MPIFPDIWIMTSVLAARALCIELPRLVSELNFEYCLNPKSNWFEKFKTLNQISLNHTKIRLCRIWIMNQIQMNQIVRIPKQHGLTFCWMFDFEVYCYIYLLEWKSGTIQRHDDVWMIVYLPRIGLSKPVERLHSLKLNVQYCVSVNVLIFFFCSLPCPWKYLY